MFACTFETVALGVGLAQFNRELSSEHEHLKARLDVIRLQDDQEDMVISYSEDQESEVVS
jgi:hypothetical protein